MLLSKRNLLSAAVIAGLGAVIYGVAFQPESDRPGQAADIQDSTHIPANAPTPAYSTNPPSSGPHSAPVKGGFYAAGVKDINAVHNLEHGFIWITYKNVDAEIVRNLKKMSQRYSGSVVVSLRAANDSPLVLTSWGRSMKMDAYDENVVIDFIQQNKNKSPERLAR